MRKVNNRNTREISDLVFAAFIIIILIITIITLDNPISNICNKQAVSRIAAICITFSVAATSFIGQLICSKEELKKGSLRIILIISIINSITVIIWRGVSTTKEVNRLMYSTFIITLLLFVGSYIVKWYKLKRVKDI